MNKSNKAALLREKWLFMYTSALERGDFETVARVLRQAEHDATLAKLIAEIDAALADDSERIVPLASANHNHRQTYDRRTPMITTYSSMRTHRRASMQGWLPAAVAAAMLLVFGAVFAWQQSLTLQPLSEPLSTQAAAPDTAMISPIQMVGGSDNGDPLLQGATLDNCQLTTGARNVSLYAQPDRNTAVVGTLPANSTIAVSVSAVRILNEEAWAQISTAQGSGWLNTEDIPSQTIICGSISTPVPVTAIATGTDAMIGVPSATPTATFTHTPDTPPSATPIASVTPPPPPTLPGIVIDLPEECRAIIDQLQVIYTDPAATGIAAISDMPVTVPADVGSVTVNDTALWVEVTITGADASVAGWVPIAPDIALDHICRAIGEDLPIIIPVVPIIPPPVGTFVPPGTLVTILTPTFVPTGTAPSIPTIVVPPLPPPVQTLIATVRPPGIPPLPPPAQTVIATVRPPAFPTVVVPTFVPPVVPTVPPPPPPPVIPTVVIPPIPTIEIPPIPTFVVPPIPTFAGP
jgi:hypothetical protein